MEAIQSQHVVIIVAGGQGSRMNTALPKQFLTLKGKPILFHTIEQFRHSGLPMDIVLVLPQDYLSYWQTLCAEHQFATRDILIAIGGETRYHSVKNGLDKVKSSATIVGIHDAARPLVNASLIQRLYKSAFEKGNAIPAVPVHESLRQTNGDSNQAVDRSQFRLIQTPQVFTMDQLTKAYTLDYQHTFTDDASVVEAAGFPIHLEEGITENIKITHPADLKYAEAMLSSVPTPP